MSTVPPLATASSPALRSFEALWRSRSPDALAGLREKAMTRLLRLGLPTARDESWRYTNPRQLVAATYVQAPGVDTPGVDTPGGETVPLTSAAEGRRWDGPAAAVVVLVNGHPLHPSVSSTNDLKIISLRDLSQTDPTLIAGFAEPLSDAEQSRWGLVNTALFEDGIYLGITGQVAEPIVILHVLAAGAAHAAVHPRVIIDAAPGSQATIIERYTEEGDGVPLCNSATHIAAGRDSRIEHYRLFATGSKAAHIDSLTLHQDGNSHCKQFTMALGGGLVRCSMESKLSGPGAALDSYALLVGSGARHVDCVNVATHDARDTRSRQWARALASGTSRVVFNSKVVVNAGAVHADSQQSSRGLLLSPTAEIDTRPQLEIHADEVKCAHGATVGRLDPNMLFYLLSRGLDRDTAQSLLVYAFLADVLTDMAVPTARSAVESALIQQLPNSQLLQQFR